MSGKPNYLKIGTFVLSALIIVVVGIVMLSGAKHLVLSKATKNRFFGCASE